MIDTSKNGVLSREEFDTMKLMFRQNLDTADHTLKQHDTFLDEHFFGSDLKRSLDMDKFIKFGVQFQNFVSELEYKVLDEKSPNTDGLSRRDFAKIVLNMTKLTESEKEERVNNLPNPDGKVTYDDYVAFRILHNKFNDLRAILRWHAMANVALGKEELERAAKLATLQEEDISMNMVELIFRIFDENGDNNMDYNEFLSIMKDQNKLKYVVYEEDS